MKKLYAILTSLFVMLAAAVPAHAMDNIWLYGNINGSNDWGSTRAIQAYQYETDKFIVELNITQKSWFRISDSENRYFAPQVDDQTGSDQTVSADAKMHHVKYHGNSGDGKAFVLEPGIYTIFIDFYPNSDKRDYGFNAVTPSPYLFGNINGTKAWDEDKKQVKLEKSGNNTFSKILTISSNSQFKLFDETSGYFYTTTTGSGDQTMVSGQTYDFKKIDASNADRAFELTPGKWKVTATALGDFKWEIKAERQIIEDPKYNITVQVTDNNNYAQFKFDPITGNYVATFTLGNTAADWFRIYFNNKYYRPSADTNLNSGDTAKGSTNGEMKVWRFTNPGTYIVTITSITDDGANSNVTFNVQPIESYYVSGNVNGWMKLVQYTGDPYKAVTTEQIAPYLMQPCADKPGWYVLDFTGIGNGKMFGQFQIIKNGDFHSDHWYLTNGDIDWNATFSDDPNTPTSMTHANDNTTGKNLHLAHNYYKNAKIYFNPATSQGYIQGEPEDLYVYYFSEEDPKGDLNVKIVSDGENNHNYWTNDKIRDAKCEMVPNEKLSEINDPVINDLRVFLESNESVKGHLWRYRVAPGLCQEFYADGTKYYFKFTVSGADQDILPASSTHSLLGENHYFIDYKLPAIFLQVVDHTNKTHMVGDLENGILKAAYIRYINMDVKGTPKYINEAGEMVANMSEAAEYPLTNGRVFDVEGTPEAIYNNGIWNHEVDGARAGAVEEWRQGVKNVSVANSSRYFEIQIDLKNAAKENTLYFSDFIHNEDGTLKRPEVATANYKLSHQDKPVILAVHGDALTGVADIMADDSADSPAVFYNLQGVRVANPTAGQIYIKVTRSGSEKVIF